MKTYTAEMQDRITPDQALDLLKEGNQRFCEGKMHNRDLLKQAEETAAGQHPIAVVLSCIDSRVSSELIFDQGIGHIFSVRIAGNIVNEDILGSMEFACKLAKSKLVVVLGHTKCGAVKGACDGAEMGNLTALLSKIKPAVEAETTTKENRTSSNDEFVSKVININVENSVAEILSKSAVLKEMVDKGECKIVGAVHDIKTGQVHFN